MTAAPGTSPASEKGCATRSSCAGARARRGGCTGRPTSTRCKTSKAKIRALAQGTGLMTDAAFNTGTRNQPLGDAQGGLSADLDALGRICGLALDLRASPYRTASGGLTDAALQRPKRLRDAVRLVSWRQLVHRFGHARLARCRHPQAEQRRTPGRLLARHRHANPARRLGPPRPTCTMARADFARRRFRPTKTCNHLDRSANVVASPSRLGVKNRPCRGGYGRHRSGRPVLQRM